MISKWLQEAGGKQGRLNLVGFLLSLFLAGSKQMNFCWFLA
jgi:hypothetical protein